MGRPGTWWCALPQSRAAGPARRTSVRLSAAGEAGPVVAVGVDGSDVPSGVKMQATGMFTRGRSG
jgi:hypothetical protein